MWSIWIPFPSTLRLSTFHVSVRHDSVVVFLLAHADIEVNLKDKEGWTPFMHACYLGNYSCVRLLLKDSRVKVDEPNKDGSTSFRLAASKGHLDVIRWWIASGREVNWGEPGNAKSDAVASLLRDFKENSGETRQRVRKELGCWYTKWPRKCLP